MTEESLPQRSRLVGWLQVAVLAVAVVVAIYFAQAPKVSTPPASASNASGTVEVTVMQPTVAAQAVTVTLSGNVALARSIPLTARVGGQVVSVSASLHAGGAFAAGEPLITIDPTDHEIALRRARAHVAAERARMRKHELQGALDAAAYAGANPGGTVPEIVRREPQIARFRARLEGALAGERAAELALARTEVSLPFGGRVLSSTAAVGAVVARGIQFGVAYTVDALQVEVQASAAELAQLGDVVGRKARALTGTGQYPVVVDRLSWAVDPRDRQTTLFLRFADDQAAPLPSPGTFAQVRIDGDVHDSAFLLPDAVEQANGTVWVVQGGALSSTTPQTLGRSERGWLVETFDTADGIVVGNVPGAVSGLPVTIAKGR